MLYGPELYTSPPGWRAWAGGPTESSVPASTTPQIRASSLRTMGSSRSGRTDPAAAAEDGLSVYHRRRRAACPICARAHADATQRQPPQGGVDPAVELPPDLGQQPDPLEAAGAVQRLAGVVRQRDHGEHLVHAVGAQPGEQLVVQQPAEALPARLGGQVDRDLAGAGVRRPRAVRRRVGVAHHVAGRGVGHQQVVARLGAGQPGLPVAERRATPGRRSRSRCGPARRRWPRFVGGRQNLRRARSRLP